MMIRPAASGLGELRRPLLSSLPWHSSHHHGATRPSAGKARQPTAPFAGPSRRRAIMPADFDIVGPITSLTPKRLDIALRGRAGRVIIGVDSCGGLLGAACEMVGALAGYSGHVTLRVRSECFSAAVGLLAGGDWVEAHAGARFLLHPPASVGGDFDRWTASAHRRQADYLDDVKDQYVGWLVETAVAGYRARGIQADAAQIRRTFEALSMRETWINTSEAFSVGLINEVVE